MMLLLFWVICDGLILLLQNNCAIDEGTLSLALLSPRILRLPRITIRPLDLLSKQADPESPYGFCPP